MAGTFLFLFIVRVFVGAGDTAISPASSALIADNFSPQKRARAYGVYACGIAIGFGPVLTGLLSDYLFGGPEHLGHSLALLSVVCGIIGFVMISRCRKQYVAEVITE